MRRYHETIYLPYNLVLDSLELAKQNHEFTTHAKLHFNDKDKSHKVNERLVRKALIALEINPPNPFEVYTKSNKVTKAVFKTSYDDTQDIVFVLTDRKVITFYLNGKNDNHITLNEGLYEHGEATNSRRT